MKLYIIRHGQALPTEIDSNHALSDKGREDIARLAQILGERKIAVSHIYHSGLLRAQQTAEILATRVDSANGIEENTDLLPQNSPRVIAMDMTTRRQDVVLVGHLPLVGELVAELVLGNPGYNLVNFLPGSLVCLERVDSRWIIDWMLA